MKTKVLKILAIISLAVLLFTACGSAAADVEVAESGETAVVIKANADGGSLEEALNALKDAGELDYQGSTGEYGLFIESVNGRAANAENNEYWAVYTTLGEADGTVYSSSEYGTYEFDGKTLASASYGVSGLPVVAGEYYALVLESY